MKKLDVIKKINELNAPHTGIFFGISAGSGASGVDWAGDGSDGDLTASGQTILSTNNTRNYDTLTIPAGQTLYLGTAGQTPVPWIIYAKIGRASCRERV